MRKLLTVIGCALLVVSVPQRMEAQDTRQVRGNVTAVTPTSLSIKVKDQVMTFNVDEKTEVTARGGTTQTLRARAEGRTNPTLPEVVKVGQGVEVRYHETGMHVASILVLAGPVDESVPEKQEAVDRRTLQGTVSAVTGKSLTVKTTEGDVVLAINEKTQVVGRGVGTAGRRIESAGGKTVITDFVAVGDSVRVVYYEKGGAKQALDVNIVAKGSIK